MKPLHKITKSYLKQSQEEGSTGIGICTTGLHPNPTFYKFYYWIYHYNMPYESAKEVFYKNEYKLSLKKAVNLINQLKKENIPFAYVNRTYYRLGTKIFDYKKLKEKYPDLEFAIAYNEDKDEVCEELNRHK